MRLVIRLFGVTVLDVTADDGDDEDRERDLSGGTTTSTGFTAPELPDRPMGDDPP